MFSSKCNEQGHQFESFVFNSADRSKLGGFLLEGNKDHLLNQARSELMKQEHQVNSINNCIGELQQQVYAPALELQDAQHGYNKSRREQVCPTRRIIYEGEKFSEMLKSEVYTNLGEMKRAQELSKFGESHETIRRLTSQLQEMQEQMNSMNDSGEFQEVESNHSVKLSHVPRQPVVVASPRSMLSLDKRLPLDTWNTSGHREKRFW